MKKKYNNVTNKISIMKTTIFAMALFFATNLMAQNDSGKVYLSQGTVLTVQLMQDISSATNNEGDIIEFETTEPIIVGDKVLVFKGAKVHGKITESEKRKAMGKAGKLNFTIDYLTMPNGKNVKLSSEMKASGKNKAGAAVAEAVLLTPLFLLKKGKTIKFEKGHIFKAFIGEDYQM